LTASEYTSAHDLALKLANGMRFEGVSLRDDPAWPDWRLLELPLPGKADRQILIGLPLVDGPWGRAATNAFFLVVAPATIDREVPREQ
jgi:hypothetical protein